MSFEVCGIMDFAFSSEWSSSFYPNRTLDSELENSGIDLRACINEPIFLKVGKSVVIPTGIHLDMKSKISNGFYIEAQVRPRSGLSSKGINIAFGTIDSGYRGEVKVTVQNFNYEQDSQYYEKPAESGDYITDLCNEYNYHKSKENPEKGFMINPGDRIAQLVFCPIYKFMMICNGKAGESNLSSTTRGNNGFGSSGLK